MLNQVVIVGRLTDDPKIEKGENHDYSHLRLAVQRSYKNAEGVYETDFINVKLWDSIASNTAEYCKKGDIIGVKGRVETSSYETEEGEKKYTQSIVAEKVTFLSSKSHESEKEESKSNDDLDM